MRLTSATPLVLLVLFAAGCRKAPSPESAHPLPADHVQQVEQWRAKHEADYRRDWVSVAGLHCSKQGPNTAGTAPDNDIRLLGRGAAAARDLHGAGPGGAFCAGGRAWPSRSRVERRSPRRLSSRMTHASARRALSRRRPARHPQERRKLSLRVRDPNGPLAKGFLGFQWFPIDPRYRVVGRSSATPSRKKLP